MRKLFLITTMLAFSATGLWAQTGGDECVVADDIAVAGFGTYVVAMTNVGATTGTDPAPSIPCAVFGQNTDDIWFSFVPDADGAIDVTTCDPASWDTDLLLYDGSGGCGALLELACSGDAVTNPGPCQGFYSEFDAPTAVTGGVTYYLRIGNWGAAGSGGAGNLTIDFFAVGAEICDDGADNDADGLIDCADPDCIGVGLCGPEICDDGFDNDGDGLVDCADVIDCPIGSPLCPVVNNDECLGAIAIGPAAAGFGIYTGFIDSTVASASANPIPAIPCAVLGNLDNDVWFSFTPDADGAITVHTCDAAGYDTDLVVYEGADCTTMVEVGCNGDSTILVGCQAYYSHIPGISVVGGQTYMMRVGSWALGVTGTGNITVDFFSISPEICDDGIDNDGDGLIDCADVIDCPFGIPPCDASGNDECDAATVIDVSAGAGTYTAFMDSTLASASANPPPAIACNVSGAFDNDIWFQFTPPVDAVAEIHTCDPAGWDTDLLVYEGPDCASMVEVACNGDANIMAGCQIFYSHVQFVQLIGGNTYFVRVGSFGTGATGTGTLTINMVIPGPEICDDGIDNDLDGNIDCLDPDCFADPNCTFTDGDECFVAIEVFDGINAIDQTTFTTGADASNITLCPASVFGQNTLDGWYTYTATVDASYWIHTCDPAGWDTDLIVYDFTAAGADCANIQGNEIACDGDSGALGAGCQAFYSFVEVNLVGGNQYLIRVGSFGTISGSGSLSIVPLLCPPMAGLAAASDCTTGDVTLGWTANAYDQIEILRDTVLIDTVDGSNTSYIDPGLASGTYIYQVQGVCAGNVGGGQTINANVASYGGEAHVIFAVEGIDDTDSVAALQAAFDANGIGYVTTTLGPAEWGCLGSDSIQCAWMMCGTYPNDYRINDADGTALASAVENGKGVYFEAGDHWGFAHLVTAYDNYDGVDQGNVADGDDSFTAMDGYDSGFGLDVSDLTGTAYNQANPGNDWTDQIQPGVGSGGPNVAQIWSSVGGGFGTGNFYATDDPFGNTISQSWEFGGFGGDQVDLVARYIAAMCGGAPPGTGFQRGDANGDGSFNIADLIFLLAALFSGGPGGNCGDANDVNDDGNINIADAINGLAALFSGGPTPPDPSPGACGTDPTDDTLDCASYTACP